MPIMDKYQKHMVFHNVKGLMSLGFDLNGAIEMANDLEDYLPFEEQKRLRLTRPGEGPSAGESGGGGSRGPGGGSEGVVTGG